MQQGPWRVKSFGLLRAKDPMVILGSMKNSENANLIRVVLVEDYVVSKSRYWPQARVLEAWIFKLTERPQLGHVHQLFHCHARCIQKAFRDFQVVFAKIDEMVDEIAARRNCQVRVSDHWADLPLSRSIPS